MNLASSLLPILGRPRRILDSGGLLPADAGWRCAAQLSRAAVAADQFDVIVIDGRPDRNLPDLLEDGGRLIVLTEHPAAVRRACQDCGLELLTPIVPPWRNGQAALIVARKPPRRRRLRLTVGMLTMDEEQSVAAMIRAIREHAPDADLLCVDSSTRDRTPAIAAAMGARVVRQLPARGHGPAMEQLMYAAAAQSELLIYLDCDFTYPPSYIPEIRRLIEEEGVDVVNAARTRRKPGSMPWSNFLANRTFAALTFALHGVATVDVHSGMRAYRSSVIRAFDFSGEGDAIPIDTLLYPIKCGYRVVEVPIRYDDRVGVSKLRKWQGALWTLRRLWRALPVGVRGGTRFEVR